MNEHIDLSDRTEALHSEALLTRENTRLLPRYHPLKKGFLLFDKVLDRNYASVLPMRGSTPEVYIIIPWYSAKITPIA